MTMPTKIVAVVSGGLDSTTMLYSLLHEKKDVYPLTFLYGQKHQRMEFAALYYIIQLVELDEKLKIVDLRNINFVFQGSAITTNEVEVPQNTEQRNLTVAPFRNGIFLSIAVAYARSIDAEQVYYAAHASDSPTYPDCRPEFIDAFASAARLGTDSEIKVTSPYRNISKAQIISQASNLNVPLQLTYS